jgi:glycosyltransferase involved in cell wall biosynthesis
MSKLGQPKITVLMPCFNSELTIRESIESVLQQTYTDFELLVINDGSRDTSGEIIEAFARADMRVRVVSQENQGIVSALNSGVELSRGSYIARLDSDDIAEAQRLERQIGFMESHPALALVGSFYTEIPSGVTHRMPTGSRQIREFLRHRGNAFVHSSVMMKRDICKALGGYRGFLPHAEDYDLWTRIADNYQVENIPEYLVRYRRQSTSISFLHLEQQAISALAVRRLSALRRNGGEEPDLGTGPITIETLTKLGCSLETVCEDMIRWIEWNGSTIFEPGAEQDIKVKFERLVEKYYRLRQDHMTRELAERLARSGSSAYF